jgi:hypothetical protein
MNYKLEIRNTWNKVSWYVCFPLTVYLMIAYRNIVDELDFE